MSSFLAQQLERLAAPQTSIYRHDHKKRSLLFEDSECKSYSRENYFEIGLSGFISLVDVEPKFADYELLFSKESKDIQRFVTDVETNKTLDDTLESFLLILSPYFATHTAAVKVMEWLMQRYCVHEMNVDAVMMCILPHYETTLFIRTLKVLNIQQPGKSGEENSWKWLSRAQKEGHCLVSAVMFDRWQYSSAFRHFCNRYLLKVIKTYSSQGKALPALKFYVTTVMGGLAHAGHRDKNTKMPRATDDHVYCVLRVLHLILKSDFSELVSGGYLIIMQLAITVQLLPDVWNDVIALILKTCVPERASQVCVCLLTLTHQQSIVQLSSAVLQLLHLPGNRVLHELRERYRRSSRVASWLVAFAGGCVKWAQEQYRNSPTEHEKQLTEMLDFVTQFTLQPMEAYAVIRNTVECFVSSSDGNEYQLLSPILERFERCYPDGFDRALLYFDSLSTSPSSPQYKQVVDIMRQLPSRKLADSLAEATMLEAMAACTSGSPAAAVQDVLRARDTLKTALSLRRVGGVHEEAFALAHSLLDLAIEALTVHSVTKSSSVKLLHPKPQSEQSVWLQIAAVEGRISYGLVNSVATLCLSLITALKPDATYSLTSSSQWRCELLAVKMLHLLLCKPKKSSRLLDQVMSRLGDPWQQLHFLSLIWGWQPSLPHSKLTNHFTRLWCLERGLQLLQAPDRATDFRIRLCGVRESLVPSLLSALTISCESSDSVALERQRQLRVSAFAIISDLWEARMVATSESSFKLLLGVLMKHSACICEDAASDQLLAVFALECEKEPALIRSLLATASSGDLLPHLSAVILFSLSHVQHRLVFESMLQSIRNLVAVITTSVVATGDAPKTLLDPEQSMLLYWSLVHFNPASLDVLKTETGWQVFEQVMLCSMDVIQLEGKLMSPQSVIAHQVTSHELLRLVTCPELGGRMWALMARAAADLNTTTRVSQRLRKALKNINLHARFVLDQLRELKLVVTVSSIRAAQQKRKLEHSAVARRTITGTQMSPGIASTQNTDGMELPSNWRSAQLLLEILCEVKTLDDPWVLVESLSDHLHAALGLGMPLAERLLQQILAALHHVLTLTVQKPPKNTELSKVTQVKVECVVQCVRASHDPYTLRRALLVLALSAKVQPDAVLHNLMTIFTFMGEGLLQRDDKFSLHVVETTVSSLLPILVKRTQNSKQIAALVQVFVDALPDIAMHRRQIIFKLVVESLQPQTHLWLVVLLIIKSYVTNGVSRLPDDLVLSTSEQSSARRMPREISFALQLAEDFGVQLQIGAANRVLQLLRELPTAIGVTFDKDWRSTDPAVEVMGLKTLSAKQLRHFIYTCVGFLGQVFVSEHFVATLCSVPENDAETAQLQASYENILSLVSSYISDVDVLIHQTAASDTLANKFWSSLQRKLVEVLEVVCALLQPELLLQITAQLVHSPLQAVRLKVTELLRTRLMPAAAFFSKQHISQLVKLLPRLHELSSMTSESVECRQLAMSALHLLLRVSGDIVPSDNVMSVFNSSLDVITKTDSASVLTMQAILVCAECCGLLGNDCLQKLPRLMPALLEYLQLELRPQALTPAEADHLPLTVASAICKVVETVPQFLAPYLEPLVVKVCFISWQQDIQVRDPKLCSKLSTIASLLRDNLSAGMLMHALQCAFNSLSRGTNGATVCSCAVVLELLTELVDRQSVSALNELRKPLMELITSALGTRQYFQVHSDVALSSDEVDMLEERAVLAATRVVFRQDEEANLSFCGNLQSWADNAEGLESLIAYYRLMEQLAGSLKVVFIKARLADHVYQHAIVAMGLTISSKKKNAKLVVTNSDSQCILLQRVLSTLTHIFSNDSIGFTTEQRFAMLLDPLLHQVKNMMGDIEAYRERVSLQLLPCVLQLCVAGRSDALWSQFNKKLLTMLREDLHPEVLASVLVITQGLVEHLKEDWLQPLLTDTLPFVTEALESSHEVVEKKARELLNLMIDIKGDEVREMLEL